MPEEKEFTYEDAMEHMTRDKKPKPVKCPKCGSTDYSANKAGYGAVKGVVGAVVAGPVGLLGGFLGAGTVELTCLSCGKKWKPGA